MLERQILKYLYANYPLAIFMTMLLNGMLFAIVSNESNAQSLFIWYLSLSLLQSFRLADYLYYRFIQQGEIYSVFTMFRNFRLGTLGTALTIGALPVLILNNVGLTELVFVAFVFAGITAGATSSLGIDRVSLLLYLLPVLLPLTFCFFSLPGSMPLVMALMIPFYSVYLFLNSSRFISRLTENVLLREEASKREKEILLRQKQAELIVKIQAAYMENRVDRRFFQQVLQELQNLSDCQYGFMCRLHHKTPHEFDSVLISQLGDLDLRRIQGESLHIDELNQRPLSLEAYFAQVITQKKELSVDSIELLHGKPPVKTLGNFYGFPLLSENRVIGIIVLLYPYGSMPDPLPELLQTLMDTLARVLVGQAGDRRTLGASLKRSAYEGLKKSDRDWPDSL